MFSALRQANSSLLRKGRCLLSLGVLAVAAFATSAALASTANESLTGECTAPDAQGIRECSAGLNAAAISRMKVSQERSQWCWAASVSMVLGFHGQSIAQTQIVTDRYGQPADLPAASAEDITLALMRASTESRPIKVSVQGDGSSSRLHVNNRLVLNELLAQRPLLVGRAAHAMVLVHVRYERFPNGAVRVVQGTVIDPAPGQGVRELGPNELRLTYFAAVQSDTSSVHQGPRAATAL